ncbi:MAG: hypothetical protein IPH44_26760 [Myxococcales bacterium]|nr:hypothetical protein [Myxococcales bacterium]
MTDEELEELRCEVQLDLRQRMRMVGTPAGAFCLFAAEHLCRTYTAAWRWQIVFDALRSTASQLDREAWVRAGMYYWHRPIVQTATQQRLLTTLVCEGGLPMHLLAEGRERHIKEFFRAVIRHAERLQVPAARVVEQHTDTLRARFETTRWPISERCSPTRSSTSGAACPSTARRTPQHALSGFARTGGRRYRCGSTKRRSSSCFVGCFGSAERPSSETHRSRSRPSSACCPFASSGVSQPPSGAHRSGSLDC